MINREGFDPRFLAEPWNAAKSEAQKAMTRVASPCGTMFYTELVPQIERLGLELQDNRLARLRGGISSEQDDAERELLTVLVVDKGAHMRAGPGFFEPARSRGRDTTDRHRCWVG